MNTENESNKPDIKHWLFQTLPPLSMLGILFTTDSGTALGFLTGLFVIPVFISLISIIVKVFRFKKRKYYMIRPALTIAFFFLILAISQWTYKLALEDATNAARIIHEECNKNKLCPENPEGWEIKGTRRSRNDLGFWFKYHANYSYKPDSFKIHVYQGPDIGDGISGGVDRPFNVSRYIENSEK